MAKRLHGSRCHLVRTTEAGLGPGHIVLYEDPAPPEKGHSPTHRFRPMYCGQTAGWMKVPLGTMVGVGPGNIALDGTHLPRKGAQQPPLFDPNLLSPNGRPSQLLLSSCNVLFYSCRLRTGLKNCACVARGYTPCFYDLV